MLAIEERDYDWRNEVDTFLQELERRFTRRCEGHLGVRGVEVEVRMGDTMPFLSSEVPIEIEGASLEATC